MVKKPLLNSVKLSLELNDAIEYNVTQESCGNQPYHARKSLASLIFVRETHSDHLTYEGGRHVGKYLLRSLVTDVLESRWYKPYELRLVPKDEYRTLFSSPILDQYILAQYGEQIYSDFYDTLPQKLASLVIF
jgi:hypothetical protein